MRAVLRDKHGAIRVKITVFETMSEVVWLKVWNLGADNGKWKKVRQDGRQLVGQAAKCGT